MDNTGEALAGVLRPGNVGANTAADHITVLDAALAQIPDDRRHGTPVLARTDSAGGTKGFLSHLRALRARGVHTSFSAGHPVTEPVRRAIRTLPDEVWHPALEQDGTLRAGAEVAGLTGVIDLDGYPDGTRIIVRRERPHPGARLSLFDLDEGMRHQVFLADIPPAAKARCNTWRSATACTHTSRSALAAGPLRTPVPCPDDTHDPGSIRPRFATGRLGWHCTGRARHGGRGTSERKPALSLDRRWSAADSPSSPGPW